MPPVPTSPHASRLLMGGTTCGRGRGETAGLGLAAAVRALHQAKPNPLPRRPSLPRPCAHILLTVAPSPVHTPRCWAVKGESHMNVFIAGASSSGLP